MLQVKKIGYQEILGDMFADDKRYTDNMKKVLAQSVLYSGLKKNIESGSFFRSNKAFANDIGIDTSTLRFVIQKLIRLGVMERVEVGNRGQGASVYKIPKQLIELNPFLPSEKVTAPRIQTLEDEGNIIKILPSDSIQKIPDNRVEIKDSKIEINKMDDDKKISWKDFLYHPSIEGEEDLLEKVLLSDTDKVSLLNKLESDRAVAGKVFEEFSSRGEEWFQWLCMFCCYTGTSKERAGNITTYARRRHFEIPSPCITQMEEVKVYNLPSFVM